MGALDAHFSERLGSREHGARTCHRVTCSRFYLEAGGEGRWPREHVDLGRQNVEGTLWSSRLRLQSEGGRVLPEPKMAVAASHPRTCPFVGGAWELNFSSRFFGLET